MGKIPNFSMSFIASKSLDDSKLLMRSKILGSFPPIGSVFGFLGKNYKKIDERMVVELSNLAQTSMLIFFGI